MSAPELTYAFEVIPAGRMPFRRWRFELWHGSALLAAGWRTNPGHAERALRAAASRFAHRMLGLHPLHPDRVDLPPGVRLVPRELAG